MRHTPSVHKTQAMWQVALALLLPVALTVHYCCCKRKTPLLWMKRAKESQTRQSHNSRGTAPHHLGCPAFCRSLVWSTLCALSVNTVPATTAQNGFMWPPNMSKPQHAVIVPMCQSQTSGNKYGNNGQWLQCPVRSTALLRMAVH